MKRLNIRLSDNDWALLEELRVIMRRRTVSETMRDLIYSAHRGNARLITRERQRQAAIARGQR